jgi:hypothetical protein
MTQDMNHGINKDDEFFLGNWRYRVFAIIGLEPKAVLVTCAGFPHDQKIVPCAKLAQKGVRA